jgi:pimeloyl-ACP methyl ester carboxylesterase
MGWLHDEVVTSVKLGGRRVKSPLQYRILTGDHDIADNQAQSGAAQVLVPGSKRIVVEDAGHLMQLEHPREVADLIADFVRKGR